jgi:hypothetical protein
MNAARTLSALTVVLLLASQAFATWSHDPDENTPICTAIWSQTHPSIISDGEGGSFIVWQDSRNAGNIDIYAQHVTGGGLPVWVEDGAPVCTATGQQSEASVTTDGEGGIIVAWQDYRLGNSDIFAQRISALGQPIWSPGGMVVCDTTGAQTDPRLVPDGTGGVFLVWEDQRSGDYDVYAQRLDSAGMEVWTANGVAVSAESYDQNDPWMVSDGQSGVFVCWQDDRSGSDDIYAQRLSASGVMHWPSTGVVVCDKSFGQNDPRSVSDGANGVIITWRDSRNGDTDIYAQRLDAYGSSLWTNGGEPVCEDPNYQYYQEITTDGEHGAIICWQDHRVVDSDIYAQRVTAAGNMLWTDGGVAVCSAGEAQQYPEIASDGAGGAVVTWRDERLLGTDVYAQRVSGSGSALWGADGVAVSTAAGSQVTNWVAPDGDGGAIVTWYDSRDTYDDIYAQRVERNGYLGYPSGEIVSVADVPGDQGGQVNLTWDASYLDPWPYGLIDYYTLWRAIDSSRGLPPGATVIDNPTELHDSSSGPVFLRDERSRGTLYWELVATVDAYELPTYAETVPTLFDSTATSDGYHYFQTITHAAAVGEYWVSLPDSARSVDNLAPGAPLALAASAVSPDVDLTWSPSGYHDEDLHHYDVHRSEVGGFTPDGTTLVGTATDTLFTDLDPGPTTWYYRVVAVDVHENGGEPSNEASATLGTGLDETPAVFALRGCHPNPLARGTEIVFDLPAEAYVMLDVYSVDGRHVATLAGRTMDAGTRTVRWDGRDGSGDPVPGGVYLYRVQAGNEEARGKLVVLR